MTKIPMHRMTRVSVVLFSLLVAGQAVGQSDAAKKAVRETANTPAAKAGKALMDCYDGEATRAKAVNLSNEQFQTILEAACLDQVRDSREALAKSPEMASLKNKDQAVDFGIKAVRIRAYQR